MTAKEDKHNVSLLRSRNESLLSLFSLTRPETLLLWLAARLVWIVISCEHHLIMKKKDARFTAVLLLWKILLLENDGSPVIHIKNFYSWGSHTEQLHGIISNVFTGEM